MKIAVFNCPAGVTAEGVVEAFVDAGLPRADLKKVPGKSRLAQKARPLASRIFKTLQRAKLRDPEKDSSKAVVQAAAGIRYFQIEKCFVRNLGIGRKGNPATLKLLQRFVLDRVSVDREIVSPAGAAILATLCEKERSIPSMEFERVGFGPDRLMVSIGETLAPYRRERILLLETNIDDMSPQGFELLYERLFKAGALDVWVEPILMKKMRPAFKLSILLSHRDQDRISEVVFKETPTLGVRFLELDRFALPRKTLQRKTRWGSVRFKVGFLDSKHSRVSPEYEDVKKIARRRNLAFRWVQAALKKEAVR